MPARHGSVFVSQASPALQTLHTPSLQTEPAPQIVPFGSWARGSSTQTDAPVEHEVTPPRHGSGFVAQATPAVHETHAPPLHTRFVPQMVPSASWTTGLSTQTDVPVAHEVTPPRHGSAFVSQASPAVHDVQAPPLHTWFVPQAVPSASCASGSSTHTDAPVEHEVLPPRHGSGLVAHARPAVHDEHAPALQTRFVPQLVPFARSAPSTQTEVPVAHDVTPRLHAVSGLVSQERPAMQEEQAPALHTRFVPQLVPFGRSAPSTQAEVPVAHDVTPRLHAVSGLVVAGEARDAGGAGAGAAHHVRAAGRAVRPVGAVHADRRAGRAGGDAQVAEGVRVGRAGLAGGAGGAGAGVAHHVRAAGRAVRLGGGVHADGGAGRARGDAVVAERVRVGRAGLAGGAGGAGARVAHEVRPADRAVRDGRRGVLAGLPAGGAGGDARHALVRVGGAGEARRARDARAGAVADLVHGRDDVAGRAGRDRRRRVHALLRARRAARHARDAPVRVRGAGEPRRAGVAGAAVADLGDGRVHVAGRAVRLHGRGVDARPTFRWCTRWSPSTHGFGLRGAGGSRRCTRRRRR